MSIVLIEIVYISVAATVDRCENGVTTAAISTSKSIKKSFLFKKNKRVLYYMFSAEGYEEVKTNLDSPFLAD